MKLIAAVLVTVLCAVATSLGSNPPASSARDLIGTWRAVAFEDRPANGPVKYPYGETPAGLLIYDSTGHMAIQIIGLPHPKVASGSEDDVTEKEKVALYDSYEAYFGTFTVDWTKHVVTHNVEGHLSDVYMGTAQERPFELVGDRLTLAPRWEVDGQKIQGIRTFERVR